MKDKKLSVRLDGDGSVDKTAKNASNARAAHGRIGEDAAAAFLERNGYTVKGRNVRFGRHELDIIAEDDEYLVFVEVKTRTEAPAGCLYTYGRPAAAVNYEKKLNTVAAANEYLRMLRAEERANTKRARIDVIEVYLARGNSDDPEISKINHIRNAFGAR